VPSIRLISLARASSELLRPPTPHGDLFVPIKFAVRYNEMLPLPRRAGEVERMHLKINRELRRRRDARRGPCSGCSCERSSRARCG
jgi:hypothetical protein